MSQIVVQNQGQVKRLDVPAGWDECKGTRGAGDIDYLREFAPHDREDIKLSFYYRGGRVNSAAGDDFLKILALPEHELGAHERKSVEQIIRDAAEPDWFFIRSLRTEQLNKRKVLVVDGIWLTNRLGNLGLFFDTDKSGTAIQEIHYVAPEAEYENFLPAALKAIQSIEWK